jgi:hypothetical protein
VHRRRGRPAADELRERPPQHPQVGVPDEHVRRERQQQRGHHLPGGVARVPPLRKRRDRKQRILRRPEHSSSRGALRHERLLPPGLGERHRGRLHEPPETDADRRAQPRVRPEPLRLPARGPGAPARRGGSTVDGALVRAHGKASHLDTGRGSAQVHELRCQLHRGEEEAPLQELRKSVLRQVFIQQCSFAKIRTPQAGQSLQQVFHLQPDTFHDVNVLKFYFVNKACIESTSYFYY